MPQFNCCVVHMSCISVVHRDVDGALRVCIQGIVW
jgi:hypothetical protein